MKNLLGETVQAAQLTFDWGSPAPGTLNCHLWVFRSKKTFCHVSPNGWTGHSIAIGHKLGEPLLQNLPPNCNLSFADVQAIMAEYSKKLTNRQILDGCINAVAKEKKLSIPDTIAYLAKSNIECIAI